MQQTFYRGYAIFGGNAEMGGLLTSLGLLAIDRCRGRIALWSLISAVAFAGILADFWFGNQPINEQVLAWAPETIPADWADLRDRWDTFHSICTAFAAVAFVSLLICG